MKIIDVKQNTEEWFDARKAKILGSNVYNVLSTSSTKDEIIAILDEHGVDYPKTVPRKEGEQPKPKGNKEVFEALLTPEMEAELMRRANKKVEFYQLIADKIALDVKYEYDDDDKAIFNDQTMMERGHQLEEEAAGIFTERTGKKLIAVGLCVRDDEQDIGNSPDRLIYTKTNKYKEALEIKCIKTAKHLQAFIEKSIPDEYFSQAVQYFVVNDDLETLYFAFYDPRIPYDCKFHWLEIKRTDDAVAKRIKQYLVYEKVLLKEANDWVERLAF